MTDYSASATITNDAEVGELLLARRHLIDQQAAVDAKIDALIPPELNDQSVQLTRAMADNKKSIEDLIKEKGSYQDEAAGDYAVLQRRHSVEWDAGLFLKHFPDCPKVVVTIVDVKKLDAHIKAGLLLEDPETQKPATLDVAKAALVKKGIGTVDTTEVTIIKIEAPKPVPEPTDG